MNLQTPNSRPRFAVSEVTKSKLNKFQYQPPKDGSAKTDHGLDATAQADDLPTKDENTIEASTGLSWEDLIDPSTSVENDEPQVSPNERIMWDTKQNTLNAAVNTPSVHRRSRKRARSSSPVSSPAADRAATPTVNVKQLAQALRSPHADPTLDLWDRFSSNGLQTGNTPLGAANPLLAQLMMSSSPRPSKNTMQPHDDVGLRRSLSHGISWPKRRKVERAKSGLQSSGEQRQLEAASKSSLVTALLDTVTSSMHVQSEDDHEDRMQQSPSPSKRRQPLGAQSLQNSKQAGSSVQTATGSVRSSKASEMQHQTGSTATTMSIKKIEPLLPAPKPQQMLTNEFDDLDDDIFDDLDDDLLECVGDLAVAGPPKQSPAAKPIPPIKVPTQAPSQALQDDLDDFDDDFDDDLGGDFDLEAIEKAAMQSMKQLGSSADNVR
jgi:DNA replication ATP-dependent helicase Dna2